MLTSFKKGAGQARDLSPKAREHWSSAVYIWPGRRCGMVTDFCGLSFKHAELSPLRKNIKNKQTSYVKFLIWISFHSWYNMRQQYPDTVNCYTTIPRIKGRWIVREIYRDAKRRGIYLALFTDPEGDGIVVLVLTKSMDKNEKSNIFVN